MAGGCIYDYVELYDGNNTLSNSLGTFCGTTAPSVIKSTGSNMTVEFITDYVIQKGGFRAVYKFSYGKCLQGCHVYTLILKYLLSFESKKIMHLTV